jgi:hypothetical protein
LDWTQGPKAAIWYFAVGIICVLAFFIQILIHWLRDFVARKMGKIDQEELTEDISQKVETMDELKKYNSSVV